MIRILSGIDLKLLLPPFFLVILGTIVLSSVSPSSFPEQFFHIFLAILVFLFFANLDIRILREVSPLFYPLSLILLLLTSLLGVVTRGSVRWLVLGPLTLQPSEIIKPLVLVFFAWLVSQNLGDKKYLLAAVLLGIVALLVLLQPDLGSTLVVVFAVLGILYLGGTPLKYFLGAGVLGVLFSPLLWRFLADYQKDRIISFLHPASDPLGGGYNSIQAMIAVGSGGFSGRGLGQGTQSQLAFLPERHTDFIFSALSEELGFVASVAVLLAFAFFLLRLINIIRVSDDLFAKSLLGGAFMFFFAQAAINIGMNLGLLPITGIPLPFVSAGGSSLVAMSAILGIVSSVSRFLKERGHLAILR